MSEGACIDDVEVAALVAGDASGGAIARARDHAATCDACREVLACVGRMLAAEGRIAAREVTEGGEGLDTPVADRVIEATPAAGSTLGRYRIGREVGRGGMGVVFEGHDPQLDRRVAIKLLHRTSDTTQLARMAREAQAVAKLSHPNVVQIFDTGLAADAAFIVMEFVEGLTLREWIPQTRPRWQRILRVFLAAARGLSAAHAQGLVHRDFKPANAMIDPQGRVAVLDFGLARPGGESEARPDGDDPSRLTAATLTATGVAVGTPSYMAPEQHRGQRVDPRADIYSLGVALYEALYGRPPFTAKTVHMLFVAKKAGLDAEPPASEVPAEVYAAIRTALAYDPDDRWDSVHAFAAALRHAARRRRGPSAWLIAIGATAVAVAAAMADPFATPPTGAGESTPVVVDGALESEAARLVEEARLGREDFRRAESLGIAYGAVLVAAASGSATASGRAEVQLGASLLDAGHYSLGAAQLRRAVGRAEELGDYEPAARGAVRLVGALGSLARPEEAVEAGRRARRLASQAGDDGEIAIAALGNEALALARTDAARSLKLQEQALAMRRAIPRFANSRELATDLHNLANSVMLVDPDRARALLTEARDIRAKALGPAHRKTTATRLSLATLDAMAGDHEGCLRHGEDAYERLPDEELRLRSRSALLLAQCSVFSGKAEAGLQWMDKAWEITMRFAEPTGPEHAKLLETKAALLGSVGDFAGAEDLLLRRLAILEAHARGPNIEVAGVHHNLGKWAAHAGDRRRAEYHERRAVEGYEAVGGDPRTLLFARIGLGGLLVDDGRALEALHVLAPAVHRAASDNPLIDRRLFAQADALYAEALWAEDPDEARRLGLAALRVLERRDGFAGAHDRLRAWLDAHNL